MIGVKSGRGGLMALAGGGRILHRALREVLLSPVIAASFQVPNTNFERSDIAVIFLSTLFPLVAALLKKSDQLALWAFVGFGIHSLSCADSIKQIPSLQKNK